MASVLYSCRPNILRMRVPKVPHLRTTLVCFGMYSPGGLKVNKLGKQSRFVVLPDTPSSLNILDNLCGIYTASVYLPRVISCEYLNLKYSIETEIAVSFKIVCKYGYVMISACLCT